MIVLMEANLKFLKGYFNVCQNIGISINKRGYDPFKSYSLFYINMDVNIEMLDAA